MLVEAHAAADRCGEEWVTKGHERPPCGVAWVTIPGTHALAQHCRDAGLAYDVRFHGSKGHPTGWTWWFAGQGASQSMSTALVSARAFAETLRRRGVEEVRVGSRMS